LTQGEGVKGTSRREMETGGKFERTRGGTGEKRVKNDQWGRKVTLGIEDTCRGHA